MWEISLQARLVVRGETQAELKLEEGESVEKFVADAQLTQLIKNCDVNDAVKDALTEQLPTVTCEKTRNLLEQVIKSLHVDVDIYYTKMMR